MKKIWCVREDIFDGDNCLWWLNKEVEDKKLVRTPMSIALKNAEIPKVNDVRTNEFAELIRRRGFL